MKLHEFFEESGMKKKVLAERANIPQATITNLLRGADVRLSTAMRICSATKGKVGPEDLYDSLLVNHANNSGDKNKKKKKRAIAN